MTKIVAFKDDRVKIRFTFNTTAKVYTKTVAKITMEDAKEKAFNYLEYGLCELVGNKMVCVKAMDVCGVEFQEVN